MKKIHILIYISTYLSNQCIVLAQDIVNPYKDYSQIPYPSTFQGGNPSLNYNFLQPMVFGDISSYKSPNNLYYLGEYELCVRKHFWWDLLGFANQPFPTNVSVSYQYEMVSFPFTMNCAYATGGVCEETNPDCSTHKRELNLPEDDNHFTYYPNMGYMQYASQL